MEKFVKILLEGIQNSIEKNHRYPWIGLDNNNHLKMVFEPGTPVQQLKDFEQGLKNFVEKNGWDKESLISKDDSQPYKRYTIHLDLESLHQLLLKQSPSYKHHDFSGSLLSILYPNRPIASPNVICLGPIDSELKRLRYGKSNLLDLVVVQLEHHMPQSEHDPKLISSFIQKHMGLSESGPLNLHQLHPDCQMVPLTEDTQFIYAEKTALTFDELEQLSSLEIPLQSFVSSYIDYLKEHLELLEQSYSEFVTNNDPSEKITHLHSELHLYEQCFHQLQQHEELKASQKAVHEIDPCLNHIGLFLAWLEVPHPEMPKRLLDMLSELPYLSNIAEDKREQLMSLYMQIIKGEPNAFNELKNLQANLFQQKTALLGHIQQIHQHLLLPIMEHLQSAHTGRSLFATPSHAEHYDQHRLKSAIENPTEIPRIIEHLQKEMGALSETFKKVHLTQLHQIENLKIHIKKLEGLITPSSPQFSH